MKADVRGGANNEPLEGWLNYYFALRRNDKDFFRLPLIESFTILVKGFRLRFTLIVPQNRSARANFFREGLTVILSELMAIERIARIAFGQS